MKKILIVTTVPETFNTILSGQVEKLAEHFEVTVITSPEKHGKVLDVPNGVKAHAVKMERKISLFKDLISLIKMTYHIREIKPDIVHSYTPKAGLISMVASYLNRIPIRVHTFTGLIFPTAVGFKKRLLVLCDKLICFTSTVPVAESKGVKAELINGLITQKELKIIGHGNIAGVDLDYFHYLNLERKSMRSFVFVGRITDDKGILELSEAFSKLPEGTILHIVGDVDDTAPPSKVVLDSLKNNRNVFFHGFLTDIRPILRIADALVLPSYREGFPNVLLQAAACGRLTVGTKVNGCTEFIKDGENGYLVDIKNSHDLYLKMKIVCESNYIDIKEMGLNARSRVEKYFERGAYIEALLNFYRGLSK